MTATPVADSDRVQDARRGSASRTAAAPSVARDRVPGGRVLRPSALPVGGVAAAPFIQRGRVLRPSAVPVDGAAAVVGGSDHPLEHEADRITDTVLRKASQAADRVMHSSTATTLGSGGQMAAPRIVRDVLREGGVPLDKASREFFEPRFRHDFSAVRVHEGGAAAASARSIHAQAYTAGKHVVFGEEQFRPGSGMGRELLAHELAHVVQDQARGESGAVHRRVEMRDVGRGEFSGFARLPELIDRLNGVANGLVFQLDGNNDLSYVENPYGTMTEFERRMKAFIDSGTPIRLRLTNQSGLLRGPSGGFTETVDVDVFESGYVDIDDLLAADDLALQTLTVHFLTERSVTKDYTRRIGTEFSEAEFTRGHAAGIDAETQVLRDFFQDNTIRFVDEPAVATGIARVWTNSRRDVIRAPFRRRGGVESWSIQVQLRGGRTMSATEYRDFLANARAAKPNP